MLAQWCRGLKFSRNETDVVDTFRKRMPNAQKMTSTLALICQPTSKAVIATLSHCPMLAVGWQRKANQVPCNSHGEDSSDGDLLTRLTSAILFPIVSLDCSSEAQRHRCKDLVLAVWACACWDVRSRSHFSAAPTCHSKH